MQGHTLHNSFLLVLCKLHKNTHYFIIIVIIIVENGRSKFISSFHSEIYFSLTSKVNTTKMWTTSTNLFGTTKANLYNPTFMK